MVEKIIWGDSIRIRILAVTFVGHLPIQSWEGKARKVRKGVSSRSRHPLSGGRVILPINNLEF